MSGIFGLLTNRPAPELISSVTAAVRALAHRGPDGERIEIVGEEPTAIFAHRRLSIFDQTSAGAQPMRDPRSGAWLTYNGAIFNYRRLREQLRARGVEVVSESDAEVALKSLMTFGEKAIDDWRGMFALGLWRPAERRLTLIRDRLGVKPLYYYHRGETLVFASEIRALLASGFVARTISRAGLQSFLTYGSIEQPLTILENVYSVPPGHILTFQDGWVRQEPYWRFPMEPQPIQRVDRSAAETAREVAELIDESVKLQMASASPLSVFLNGGVDASVITALASRTSDLKSFSLGVDEKQVDPLPSVVQTARGYRVEHTAIVVAGREALDATSRALRAMDQPSLGGVDDYLISEAASQAGMKVALTGIGGDELFAGHPYFQTLRRDEFVRAGVNATPPLVRSAAASALDKIGSSHRAARLTAMLRGDDTNTLLVERRRTLFAETQRRALTRGERHNSPRLTTWNERRIADASTADAVNQASMLELSGYLANTLLRNADVMGGNHGVEIRTPLLDHKLVEQMLSIPGRFKLREGKPKWMMLDAVPDMPKQFLERAKPGFELPFDRWIRGSLRDRVQDTLSGSKLSAFLDANAVQMIWASFLNGSTPWSRVWALHVLGHWMEIHL